MTGFDAKIVRMMIRLQAIVLFLASATFAQSQTSFDGVWVLASDGRNLMKVEIQTKNGSSEAIVTHPKQMTIAQDGSFSNSSDEFVTEPPVALTMQNDSLKFANGVTMTRSDENHASMSVAPQIHPLSFLRVSSDAIVVMGGKGKVWPAEIEKLRRQIEDLAKEDQDARLALNQDRMRAADAKAHEAVNSILDHYGWVNASLAGADAAHRFWLLVQHQDLDLQQRALPLLKKAADSGTASKTDYAYLYDRVQVRSGKLQYWGTQTQCAGTGPVLMPVEDPERLDTRRSELRLVPEAEYLHNQTLASSCKQPM
jgi:hypothetical protein